MITREEFMGKGAAYKAVFMVDYLEQQQNLAATKDIIATADSRDAAENLKQYVIDEVEAYDHVDTGRLQNSIGVRSLGGGEYGVTAVDYAKYVNGYDREADGQGFIDVAVQQTILDTGEDIDLMV